MTATVVGLQIAKASRLDMVAVDAVDVVTGGGIVGDRYEASKHRHVSIQSLDELSEAEAIFGAPLDPLLTRRNITIDAGAVPRSPGHRWRIGAVELEVVRDAAPCKLLDDNLGVGARAAMRRKAGVICRVLEGGRIEIGASVDFGEPVPSPR